MADLKRLYRIGKRIINKNGYIFYKSSYFPKPAQKNRVNINAWVNYEEPVHNLGDWLSPIVVKKTAELLGIDAEKPVSKTKHLYAVGSILPGWQDSTAWGTGFLHDETKSRSFWLFKLYHRLYHTSDIRAVRGPKTKQVLDRMGIACPEVYGDPALLLPILYSPKSLPSEGILLIPHYNEEKIYASYQPQLSMKTDDWQGAIDRIASAKRVITSSLHGIIIAEAYGVPAVLLKRKTDTDMFKYEDYYYSTERFDFPAAQSVEEALSLEPSLLSREKLSEMQAELLKAFPRDLWE